LGVKRPSEFPEAAEYGDGSRHHLDSFYSGEAVARWHAGESIDEIAAGVGVGSMRVVRLLRSSGVTIEQRERAYPRPDAVRSLRGLAPGAVPHPIGKDPLLPWQKSKMEEEAAAETAEADNARWCAEARERWDLQMKQRNERPVVRYDRKDPRQGPPAPQGWEHAHEFHGGFDVMADHDYFDGGTAGMHSHPSPRR
jgi:hypothetical protein